ncbi:MAG: DUF2804 domain-containing protein [Deltaproteobacteria bacterium]|nr:MAG: DUF2804 domain-containing protein [Deltaproteobacteria bacterium]
MQREIVEAGPLLSPKGVLHTPGWARKPLLAYDRSLARGRLKEWDYYCILREDFGLAVTVADLGYIGFVAVAWLDFENGSFHSSEMMRPFTRGKLALPASSEQGDVEVAWGKRRVHIRREAGERTLTLEWPDFRKGEDLRAEIALTAPETDDGLVVATPFPGHATAFYYNHKQNCLSADGEVQLGEETHHFTPATSMGVLDWGRGVWTWSNTWYWGSASGKVGKKRVGFNLGYGFGDLSTHTENIAFVDGVGHKLDEVQFAFGRYMDPWQCTSNDGRFEMTFTPILDRHADINLLVFRSLQHQVFGTYSGKVVLDDGSTLEVPKLLGFAEKVVNRW